MTDFSETIWAKVDFSREYAKNADIFIPERRKLLEIMKSFYRNFLAGKKNNILDLGCGDGILTGELLGIDRSISATLVDGSDDMLRRAKDRLKGSEGVSFIKTGFQELLRKDTLSDRFDLIVSSLAIHHLDKSEKTSLFEYIFTHLNRGGYFLNIDVVLSPSERLEQWYLFLWKEWIIERQAVLKLKEDFTDVPNRYKNKDNKPDTLEDQLGALKATGFKDVDCFYKYGIFTVYGGRS